MSDNPYEGSIDSSESAKVPHRINPWLIVFGVGGVGLILVMLLLPATRSARPAARRNQCINNLKNIGLALHNYHDVHGEFPPAYTVDEAGKPLHSWRTLLLPFLEEQALYDSIDLTKPWDDPVNAKAFQTVVHIYCCPELWPQANQTGYLAIVTDDSCLRPERSLKKSEITDGTNKTMIVIEMPLDQTVPWMAPQDASEEMVMQLKEADDLPHYGATNSLFADCHVVSLVPNSILKETLSGSLTATGNEPMEID